MSFWCIYEATLISEGSGQNNNQTWRMGQMTIVNNKNWFQIKYGTLLRGNDGKLWRVVYRDAHHGILDVAPNGAMRGQEARIVIQNNAVVVQSNWTEARLSLAGCRTTIAA